MQFTDAIRSAFTKYVVFDGRARRSEYWYFFLFNYLVSLVLSLIPGLAAVAALFFLATLIPSLAVCCRRLHDVGKNGLWCLISLVPIVGTIILIVWLAQEGQPGPNMYGPDPRNPAARPRSNPAPAAPASVMLRCLAGPMQGQCFPIGSHGIMMGRTPECAIRFPDGTPGVSGRHCSLLWRQGMLTITDLGSTHGTFLSDGRQLPPNDPRAVTPGIRFYLGSTQNLFQIETYQNY